MGFCLQHRLLFIQVPTVVFFELGLQWEFSFAFIGQPIQAKRIERH